MSGTFGFICFQREMEIALVVIVGQTEDTAFELVRVESLAARSLEGGGLLDIIDLVQKCFFCGSRNNLGKSKRQNIISKFCQFGF